MSKQDDLEKQIVNLLTNESIEEKIRGCNLALGYYYQAILSAIKHRYPKVSKEDAEDIAQNVGLVFCKKVEEGKYKDSGKLEGYLRRIADYQTLKFLGQQKESPPNELYLYYQEEDTPYDIKDDLQKDSYDKDRIDLFYKCVDQLPEKLRDIYLRFYEDDQRLAHIAEKLGMSVNLVKQHLYNLRKQLKNCVKNKKDN